MARSQGRQLFLFWTLVCKEHQHNMINTTPPRQHHQHNAINTSSSTQHHQHNTINTTSSTQHHQHNTINTTSVSFCVAGAALGAHPERSAKIRRRLSTMDAGCFCVACAALGEPQSHFAWQVRHSDTAHGAKNFLHTLTIYSLRKSFSSFSTILPLLPHSS